MVKSTKEILEPDRYWYSYQHNGSQGVETEIVTVYALEDGEFIELPEVVGMLSSSNYSDVANEDVPPDCTIGEALERRELKATRIFVDVIHTELWAGGKPRCFRIEYSYKGGKNEN